jgi:tetratricopeptide (TPR) repeat protein
MRSLHTSSPVETRLETVFHLVLCLPEREPAPNLPRRLGVLFRELSAEPLDRPADDLEDLIWALWISHEDRTAEEVMVGAVEAMASGHLDQARSLLDYLIDRYPEWPEAWNKRATLAFMQNRDADSLADLERTLLLEPRHFGAVSGFAQICLRNGRLNEARAAFQVALAIDPHLESVRAMVEELSPDLLMLH